MLYLKLLRISELFALARKALVQILGCPSILRYPFFSLFIFHLSIINHTHFLSLFNSCFYAIKRSFFWFFFFLCYCFFPIHEFSVYCNLNERGFFIFVLCTFKIRFLDLEHWLLYSSLLIIMSC